MKVNYRVLFKDFKSQYRQQMHYSANAGNLANLGSWISTKKYIAPETPVEEESHAVC